MYRDSIIYIDLQSEIPGLILRKLILITYAVTYVARSV